MPRPKSWRYLLISFIPSVATFIYEWFTVLLGSGRLSENVRSYFIVGSVVAIGVGIFGSYFLGESNEEKRMRKRLKHLLDTYVPFISSNNSKVRAFIFLRNEKREELYVFAYYGYVITDELKHLRFKQNQGFVGKVFWRYSQPRAVRLDVSDISNDVLKQVYSLTDQQIKYTRHVSAIFAANIWSAKLTDPSPLGILSVDTDEPLATSGFVGRSAAQAVLNLANAIAGVIEADL